MSLTRNHVLTSEFYESYPSVTIGMFTLSLYVVTDTETSKAVSLHTITVTQAHRHSRIPL
jgi:hypothetical protein